MIAGVIRVTYRDFMTEPARIPLDAPIVSVTVYPGQARVTRRGTAILGDHPEGPGAHRVTLGGLPLDLDPESVRVTGRGDATIQGVDIATSHQARGTGPEGRLREQLRNLTRRRGELADARRVIDAELALLDSLGSHAGRTFAKALAQGTTEPTALGPVTDYVGQQVQAGLDRRRQLDDEDTQLADEQQRTERELASVTERGPDTMTVTIDVLGSGTVAFDVGYLVYGASWTPRYDIRLADERLSVDWFASVSQHSGENWPPCEVRLSTARPTGSLELPELDPWFLRDRPPRPAVRARGTAYGAAAADGIPELAAAQQAAGAADEAWTSAEPMATATAAVEHGLTAATYTARQPTAIPPDGTGHNVLIASFGMPARLDYVVAPARDDGALLRVVASNDSEHTLSAGRAALFHGPEFVGSTDLETWAPGEELELALGIDDRIRVERKLVSRKAGKAVVGSTRRHEVRYRTTVGNHTPGPATVTVLDQIPVSKSADIVVRDVSHSPAPHAITDLGEVRWELTIQPGAVASIEFGFRVDVGKNVVMEGWRE